MSCLISSAKQDATSKMEYTQMALHSAVMSSQGDKGECYCCNGSTEDPAATSETCRRSTPGELLLHGLGLARAGREAARRAADVPLGAAAGSRPSVAAAQVPARGAGARGLGGGQVVTRDDNGGATAGDGAGGRGGGAAKGLAVAVCAAAAAAVGGQAAVEAGGTWGGLVGLM